MKPSYNPRSIQALVKLFPHLEPVQQLSGVYLAELAGPAILRPFQQLFLKLTGLPNWRGKHFVTTHHAVNLITHHGKETDGPNMLLSILPSHLDKKEGLVASYDENAPALWRRYTDEFRWVNENTILGMSKFNIPGFRNFPVMFILHKEKNE